MAYLGRACWRYPLCSVLSFHWCWDFLGSRISWNLVWSCLDPIPPLHLQQVHFLIYQSLWLPFHTGRCWVLPLSWFKWFPESLTTSLDETFAFEHVFLPLASFRSPCIRQLCLTQAQPLVLSSPLESLCLLYLVLPGSWRCLELSVSRSLSSSSMGTVSYNSFRRTSDHSLLLGKSGLNIPWNKWLGKQERILHSLLLLCSKPCLFLSSLPP